MKIKPILFSTPMVQAILDGRKSQTRRTRGLGLINKEPNRFTHFQKYGGMAIAPLTGWKYQFWDETGRGYFEKEIKPKYEVGEILWVRETWRVIGWSHEGDGFDIQYMDGTIVKGVDLFDDYDEEAAFIEKLCDAMEKKCEATINEEEETFFWSWEQIQEFMPWKPSIYMPKAACRIFLEVTDVRAERLQGISEGDAIAEGIERTNDYWGSDGSKNYMYGSEKGFRHEWFFDDAPYGIENTPSVNGIISSFFTLIASIHSWEFLQSNPWVWVYDFKRVEKPENFL